LGWVIKNGARAGRHRAGSTAARLDPQPPARRRPDHPARYTHPMPRDALETARKQVDGTVTGESRGGRRF
jgi:hypothetical protein